MFCFIDRSWLYDGWSLSHINSLLDIMMEGLQLQTCEHRRTRAYADITHVCKANCVQCVDERNLNMCLSTSDICSMTFEMHKLGAV